MKQNVIREKSYEFAVKIVKYVSKQKYELCSNIILKQLVRCATSVGANTEEAHGAQTDKDFVAKLYIVNKELLETIYWLRLLGDVYPGEILTRDEFISDAYELKRILSSIILSTKNRMSEK
jgi:four helix bundle protein